MVDDDEEDFILVRAMLSSAKRGLVNLTWADSYEAGKAALYENEYDAILLDYDLGTRNGIDLIREVSSSGYSAPLILFTGRGSIEVDMEAMQAGASLYLTKGETSELLLERGIRYAIERKNAQRSLAENQVALKNANEVLSEELRLRTQIERELSQKSEKLEQILYRQQVISEAAAQLLAGADPVENLEIFFNHFSLSLGLEIYVQYNVSDDGNHLELNSIAGIPENYLPVLQRLEFGQAVCGTVAQRRAPIYVNNVQESDDRKVRLIKSLGIGTYACHPLIVEGKLLGTLSFGSKRLNAFDNDTILLLKTFCSLVAHAFARKKNEIALTRSREEFRVLTDNMAQMVWMTDENGNRTWFNNRWYEYTGKLPEDVLGKAWKSVIHPDFIEKVEETIQNSLKTGKPWELVYPIKSKNNEWRLFLTHCIPVNMNNGRALRWFGTNTDVTDQTQLKNMPEIRPVVS